MKDYIAIWKRRRLEVIVVNILALIICIIVAVDSGEWIDTIFFGIILAWGLCALISAFSKSENSAGGIVKDFILGMFSGVGAASFGGGFFFIFFFVIYMIKVMFALLALTFLIITEFVFYPFTTIYYYIRYRMEKN